MRELSDYHHFRRDITPRDDRVAQCERRVVQLLLASTLSERERESSVTFELKHHHSTAQFARVLARKRRLPVEACTVGALLHDIYVITDGRYEDHAHRGAPIAKGILDEIGGFGADEESMIDRIVYHHSDKHLWSDDVFVEFGKDADVLDCFLYPGAFGFYLRHKSLAVFQHYLARARQVWSEVGMPSEPRFDVLSGYGENWLDLVTQVDEATGARLIATIVGKDAPPLLLRGGAEGVFVAMNQSAWEEYLAQQSVAMESAGRCGRSGAERLQAILRGEAHGALGDESIGLEEAKRLLRLSQAGSAHALLWPALDAYELIGSDSARLAELSTDERVGM